MYNLSQFLYKSNEYLFDSDDEIIDDARILKFAHIMQSNRYPKRTRKTSRVIHEDFYGCDECDGNREGVGNYVNDWGETSIINEYPLSHYNSRFNSAYIGSCDWCNTLHIECPSCHSVTAIGSYKYDENIECEGGCGIIFHIESDPNHHNIDSFDIKIVDHRVEECSYCGEGFIDDGGNLGICSECEKEYGTER